MSLKQNFFSNPFHLRSQRYTEIMAHISKSVEEIPLEQLPDEFLEPLLSDVENLAEVCIFLKTNSKSTILLLRRMSCIVTLPLGN
jgi:hypothetical protein